LKLATEEEVEWELERKSVACKALVEMTLEEIYGPAPGTDGPIGTAIATRLQQFADRDAARVERYHKRKIWRQSEWDRELNHIESEEKRLRTEEIETDRKDKEKQDAETRERETHAAKLAKRAELALTRGGPGGVNDAKPLVDLVDMVQAVPRNELFKMPIDSVFLRKEKILENKLRPWLEVKVDHHLGGAQNDLVEYVLRRVNAMLSADALIQDLERFMEDQAGPLVERMWRMLILELTRGGKGLTEKQKLMGA